MDEKDPRLRGVWNQKRLPVVIRGGRVRPLVVRLPFDPSNREWLRNDRRTKPEWLASYTAWSVPKSWFEETLRRFLGRYGAVYVIQPFSESEKCAPACWNAVG